MSKPVSFSLVAGEASGDLLAGLLLGGLKQQWPDMHSAGIGGPRMAQHGFQAWWPYEKLAVRGYVEVLRHYREIVGIRAQLKQRLLANPPSAFIGVDAPDFNLDLERDLKAAGIPAVHFVCPSIWAWRADRVEKIRQSVDHVLCIFPFETELLAQHGIASTYVGHPLAQTIPDVIDQAAARAQLGLPMDAKVVALLPGSRRAEIAHLAPRFFSAARLMLAQRPQLRFAVPVIPALMPLVEAAASEAGFSGEQRQRLLLEGQSHAALAACDVTLIASGTATLEAALFKRPMVIAYNMHWLSWQIMRRKKLQAWVGLPNILCQEFVVPELLQDAATPDALASEVLQWLDQPARIQHIQQRFAALHDSLRRDTPTLAAHAIEKILAR
ncbi:MAG: lipid-A-disaccharide synthase [Betaproteobacteria bacterium]|nr:lipid-A-disaccharide synthase [Betaproteobacteria bacterium]